jgi:hypothetical protein
MRALRWQHSWGGWDSVLALHGGQGPEYNKERMRAMHWSKLLDRWRMY